MPCHRKICEADHRHQKQPFVSLRKIGNVADSTDSAGLDHDSVKFVQGNDFFQILLEIAFGGATDATTRNFKNGTFGRFGLQDLSINRDLPEFVDDDGPVFPGRFFVKKPENGSGFACAQKTCDDMDGDQWEDG